MDGNVKIKSAQADCRAPHLNPSVKLCSSGLNIIIKSTSDRKQNLRFHLYFLLLGFTKEDRPDIKLN